MLKCFNVLISFPDKQQMKPSGTLFIVATPIGNLKDLSARAIETLKSVSCIYAEDTRHFGIIKNCFSIATPTKSLHEHNEKQRIASIMEQLASGDSLALVSDAGTPLISDPGFLVVREARKLGYSVIPIPGPSAFLVALSVCGFPVNSFSFYGFLPVKQGKRLSTLQRILATEDMTAVLYESTYRIEKLLTSLESLIPDRQIFVGRELTKLNEEHLIGTATELLLHINTHSNSLKGEFVVVIPAQ